MQDLIKQEQFELEVLDKLNSMKVLGNLVFCGGTMLRLCFGLNRFSVDLDFWVAKPINEKKLYSDLKEQLTAFYTIKDSADKHYTALFELRSANYPRSMKIEIRKSVKKVGTEQAIAYSAYSDIQVLLKVVSLPDMMKAKMEALIERKEIRDAFDMEFLLKKGVKIESSSDSLITALDTINTFSRRDYTVKLGSLLSGEQREYYNTQNFRILKMAIQEQLNSS